MLRRTLATGLVLVLPLIAQSPPAPAPAAGGALAIDDWWQWESVADPRLSPDGTTIVFARTWFDPIADRSRTELWLMGSDGSRMRQLATGGDAQWYGWRRARSRSSRT
jgi:dipeptidyl aminopeptidase/acylaminoacyl peptidase